MQEMPRPKTEGTYYAARDLQINKSTRRSAGEPVPEAHDWTLTPALVRAGKLMFRPHALPDPPRPVAQPTKPGPGDTSSATSPPAASPASGAEPPSPAPIPGSRVVPDPPAVPLATRAEPSPAIVAAQRVAPAPPSVPSNGGQKKR